MRTIIKQTAILLLLITPFLSNPIFGQGKAKEKLQQKKAEIETERVAFYTTFLNLSPDEATKFWPIYKEYTQKQKEIRKNTMKGVKNLRAKPIDQLTTAEANEMIKAELSMKQALLDLEKEYVGKFQTAISIQKVAKLKQAEGEFKKELIKKAREKKKQRMEQKGPKE